MTVPGSGTEWRAAVESTSGGEEDEGADNDSPLAPTSTEDGDYRLREAAPPRNRGTQFA
jgi:hypothetical protein